MTGTEVEPIRGQLPPPGTPRAEVKFGPDLVRALLAKQQPDLAKLPLAPGPSGWDNATYRLGENLAVRMPRRAVAAALVQHEQRWLPVLAPTLPLPIPAAVRHGTPDCGSPWPWSVVPWFDGDPADRCPPDPPHAAVLGPFLRALHVPAPPNAPHNPHRGVPVRQLAENLTVRLDALGEQLGPDADRLRAIFAAGAAATEATTATWLHGDLHPRNVLTSAGRLSAIIDWGDLTRGDAATDIAGLWMLFDPSDHPAFWENYRSLIGGDQMPPVSPRVWSPSPGTAQHQADEGAPSRVRAPMIRMPAPAQTRGRVSP